MSDGFEVEGQPNGISVEKTLDVVANILDDSEFAEEVAKHNGFDLADSYKDLSLLNFRHRVAIQFLACRYQWSVDILSRRTEALLNQQNGLAADVDYLMSRDNKKTDT